LSNLRVRGDPVAVLDDVQSDYSAGASYFALSNTGTLAYLPRSQWTPKSTLVWVDRAGHEETLVGNADYYSEPRLSPDQRSVAFTKEQGVRGVWLYDRRRRLTMPLARHDGSDFDALWTPDGAHVVYASEGQAYDIHWRAADLSADNRTLIASPFDKFPSSFTSDGKQIAYVEVASDGSKIKFFCLDTTARPLTFPASAHSDAFVVYDAFPVFSPSGRWLAYVSNESGRSEVYARHVPDFSGQRRQISIGGGTEPRWTKGGRELVFRNDDTVFAAAVNPVTGESAHPVALFSAAYVGGVWDDLGGGAHEYDVTPDGARFLFAKPQTGDATADVVIVANWLSELTKKFVK
jgi:Tol biopolymer transport system component